MTAHPTSSAARLRVLMLVDQIAEAGGAERFTLGLATHLPADRCEVWVCATRRAEPRAIEILDAAGVRLVVLGRRSKFDVWRFGRLIRLLRQRRFDVLHSHMFGSNVWGTVIGRLCRVPVVIAEEHTWSYEGQLLRRLLDGYLIGRLATRFIAVSAQDARRMVELEHVPEAKVTMIPSAYVPRPAAETDIRAELGIDAEAPLLAIVAVLREQKAIDVTLEAMGAVLDRHPTTQLVIAGDGPCSEALRQHAHRLDLDPHVHFLGRRTDVEAIISAADVVVISSDYEGTPLVAYECFANHTPLVSTAVGGLVDLIQDGVTGRLVPRRDPAALASAIGDLLDDPALRQRLADAAAASPAGVGVDVIAERFATLYAELATAGQTNGGGPAACRPVAR